MMMTMMWPMMKTRMTVDDDDDDGDSGDDVETTHGLT